MYLSGDLVTALGRLQSCRPGRTLPRAAGCVRQQSAKATRMSVPWRIYFSSALPIAAVDERGKGVGSFSVGMLLLRHKLGKLTGG